MNKFFYMFTAGSQHCGHSPTGTWGKIKRTSAIGQAHWTNNERTPVLFGCIIVHLALRKSFKTLGPHSLSQTELVVERDMQIHNIKYDRKLFYVRHSLYRAASEKTIDANDPKTLKFQDCIFQSFEKNHILYVNHSNWMINNLYPLIIYY